MVGKLGHAMNDIANKYYVDDGTRKSVAYFAEYERIFQHRRNEAVSIIELGVFSGASMLVWRDYLPNATIVGLDSAKTAPATIKGDPRLRFVSGQQDDPATMMRALTEAGGSPALIVDDCSHIARITKRSFNFLFPYLAPGGSYAIEDIGTSFLTGVFDDGRDFVEPPMIDADPDITDFPSHTNGLVGVIKQYIDHVQRDVATRSHKTVPIERISVISNMAVIEKSGG